MKDQKVIKKLQLLKTMQPGKHTLKGIKDGVYQQMQSENRLPASFGTKEQFSTLSPLTKSYGIALYVGVFACLLILFLAASVLFLPNQTHEVILNGRIALAPNQYEKARIALEDTKSKFKDNKVIHIDTNQLAYSLTLTNTQLNALKLKGEKGQYTEQECHQLYQEYLSYLENKEKAIPSNNSALKSQINAYQERAEKKLHMYNSL